MFSTLAVILRTFIKIENSRIEKLSNVGIPNTLNFLSKADIFVWIIIADVNRVIQCKHYLFKKLQFLPIILKITKNITNFEFLFSLFPKYGIAPQCGGFRTHNFFAQSFARELTKIATSTSSPPTSTTTLLKSKIKLSFLFFACQKPLFLLFPWQDMYYIVLLLFLDYLEMIRNNFYYVYISELQKYQFD